MNKYEYCFHGFHGEPGRFKHRLTRYCKEGHWYDSKTDIRLTNERCLDWFDRCEELSPRRRRGGWEPKVGWEPKSAKWM